MTLSEKEKATLLEQLKEAESLQEQIKRTHKVYFFNTPEMPANPLQAELLEAWEDPTKKVFTYTGANRIGKTCVSANIISSVMAGKWLWSNEKIPFPHHNPRKIRWVGQDWQKHIKTVIIPALKEWWPQDRPVKIKKDNQGIETFWTDVTTGSTLEIMSNKQESDVLEGWHGDLIVYDEPPKRDIRVACARGLIDRQGRELFAMTLLKEAWVHREIIKAINPDGTPDTTIYNIHGDIYANVGFGITESGVAQFEKTLTDEQKEARLRGIPSYMSGLVLPQFKRKAHLKKRFAIPLNWMVDIAIDVHPRERQAVLFTATSEKNERYCCNEIWGHGDGKWIGDNIVRCVKQNVYRVNRVIIDPLAKGDSNQDATTYETIARILARHDMMLEIASKDKDNGILMIKEHLEGANNMPSLFFFEDMVRTLMEIEGWMWDEKTQKAVKQDDHFCENLYRTLLLDTHYYEPEDEEDEGYQSTRRNSVTGY